MVIYSKYQKHFTGKDENFNENFTPTFFNQSNAGICSHYGYLTGDYTENGKISISVAVDLSFFPTQQILYQPSNLG